MQYYIVTLERTFCILCYIQIGPSNNNSGNEYTHSVILRVLPVTGALSIGAWLDPVRTPGL